MAFVDLEKDFDRVPREVLWWALRRLFVDEWLVTVIQSMYDRAATAIKVNGGLSKEFPVKVEVHQGSFLSPLLFIIVMEAMTKELQNGFVTVVTVLSVYWSVTSSSVGFRDRVCLVRQTRAIFMHKCNTLRRYIIIKTFRPIFIDVSV